MYDTTEKLKEPNRREDIAGLKSQLESMGADLVLTEEEMRSTKVTTWYCEIECWRHFVTDSHTCNIRCGSQGNFQNPSWASTVWVVLVVSSFARLHKDLSNCENLLICFHLSLCQALATRGVHVTYGGMSRKPVTAATSHMIFKVSSRNDTHWIYSLRPCLSDGW